MFERSLELLSQVRPSAAASVPALRNYELSRRLRQLDYLLDRARASCIAAGASNDSDHELFVEQAITYAECFYLIAWRVGVALKPLSGRAGRFSPRGVLEVRNWIIQHPEGEPSAPPLPTWGISGDGDVRLSLGAEWPEMDSGPTYRDEGLLANAEEFRAKLEDLLLKNSGAEMP